MPYITCNGVKLNYETSGAGEKSFLLLHNAGGNLRFMNYQFQHLSQKGKVLSIDLRGHGESDKPNTNYCMSLYPKKKQLSFPITGFSRPMSWQFSK